MGEHSSWVPVQLRLFPPVGGAATKLACGGRQVAAPTRAPTLGEE